MKKNAIKKIRNQSGESITETLVALLISALALVMLAGAVSSASNVVNKSRDKLGSYYSVNETDESVIKRVSGVRLEDGVVINDGNNVITAQTYDVDYYSNTEFANTPVVSYSYAP